MNFGRELLLQAGNARPLGGQLGRASGAGTQLGVLLLQVPETDAGEAVALVEHLHRERLLPGLQAAELGRLQCDLNAGRLDGLDDRHVLRPDPPLERDAL